MGKCRWAQTLAYIRSEAVRIDGLLMYTYRVGNLGTDVWAARLVELLRYEHSKQKWDVGCVEVGLLLPLLRNICYV